MAPANCKAAVCGSGIASGYTEWDGKIVMEERINAFTMVESVMNMKLLSDSVAISMQKQTYILLTVLHCLLLNFQADTA